MSGKGKPESHFDPESFRRMKDYSKRGYYGIVGCPKGRALADEAKPKV